MSPKKNLLWVVRRDRYVRAGLRNVTIDTPASHLRVLVDVAVDDAAASVGNPRWRQRE